MTTTTDLATQVAAGHTTIVCMEMERGVVGDLSTHPIAVAVRESGVVERIARLHDHARAAGIKVVHCTAQFRADRAGSFDNMWSVRRPLEDPTYLLEGTPSVQVVPELWADGDVVSARYHGISAFGGTSLDSMLRSLGTGTIVATGVSLNLGILGIGIEGVNHGYQIVVPKDCVVGFPADYAELIIKHSLRFISTITTADDIIGVWSGA